METAGKNEVLEYRPGWTWDHCGCSAPERIRVLPDGRAIADYEDYGPTPYRDLDALIDNHVQGGSQDPAGLRASMGEPTARRPYQPGELFAALRSSIRVFGRMGTAAGYLPLDPEPSAEVSNPRPSRCAPAAVDLDVLVTLGDGRTLAGEVTFSAAEHNGRPRPHGMARAEWISSGLLAQLEEALSERQRGELVAVIMAAASRAIPGRWGDGRYEIDSSVLSPTTES